MKIEKPTDVLPADSRSRDDGKYADVYRAIDKLAKGQWLPVKFDNRREAYNFRITAQTHRTRLLEAVMRKDTVYVRAQPLGKKPKEK